MFRKYFFLFFFFFFSFYKAQILIGLKPALSFGFINTSKENRRGFAFDQTWPGAGLSLIGEYRFLEKFAFQLGASWIEKNHHVSRSPNTFYYFNNFLEVPLNFKFFLFEKKSLKPFLALGGYMAYWIGSYEKGNAKVVFKRPNQKSTRSIDLNLEQKVRWDAGVSSSFGIEYQFNPRHYIFLESQFSYGLKNIRKKLPEVQRQNHMALVFHIGYFYQL